MSSFAIPNGRRVGSVKVPASKSMAHRAIICAMLGGTSDPVIDGESKDTVATRACLKAMDAGESVWLCGESGSTLRFLIPVAGVKGAKGAFHREGRLAERPLGPFLDELRAHGMTFEEKGVDLVCGGKLESGRFTLPGSISSQFVSGLLMALPLATGDSEIFVTAPVESAAYIALTESALAKAGIRFEREERKDGILWKVPGAQRFSLPGGFEVEGDWSQAAFWLAMGVSVTGVDPESLQGDKAIVWLLSRLGTGKDIDVSGVPDLVPAMAARAASTVGVTRFVNGARLRIKESDRLASTCAMVNAVGGSAKIVGDDLIVEGRERLLGGKVETCADHRIAMAASVLAAFAENPVEIDDRECVAKSYPRFWEDLESLERVGQ